MRRLFIILYTKVFLFFLVGILTVLLFSCSKDKVEKPLFTAIESDQSNISFANNLSFDQAFNIYTYRNYYNGGGVAIGDINNDGLQDVYFTSNIESNKLYLNHGNFQFEDITEKAGVKGARAWSTGVSMADVNGDGLIDIYVCNSGDIKGDNKQNELFINNGDLTFTERAEEFGIADKGFTTHAVFFDYDKDDDLDLYILNNSYQAIGSFNLRKNERPTRDSLGGDKLMRNVGNKFEDVSKEAGIYGSVIGFGLGVTVGDVDKDGWPDIYVSNDFFERDYLYINNRDGTFGERLTEQMKSISGASMGADLADINNDSYPDIFVTEMLPNDNARLKTVTTFENWDRYKYNVQNGYFHQFTRNMLQRNNGDKSFSEIGRLAGVEATDWSWGALIFDMDNDGYKDIFVSNGIFQDLTNQDYLQFASNTEMAKTVISRNGVDYKKLIDAIPSTPVSNFAYQNQDNLKFLNKAKEWGLSKPGFSNGAAYGDLDNDGDLDIVINNINEVASVFRNETNNSLLSNRYLKFELKGVGKNTFAFGTKITIRSNDKIYYVEQMPIRGFESSMDPRPNVGLGNLEKVEQILVEWPDGSKYLLRDVPTNQIILLDQKKSSTLNGVEVDPHLVLSPIFQQVGDLIKFKHIENEFVDFDRDHLIYHMLSTEGPRISKGDVNADGREDIYVGGAKDQSGALFIQQSNGFFVRSNENVFEIDKGSEDMGSVFFDADGDLDLDLYVCSGGSEFSNVSTALIDRLYINDGTGKFNKSSQVLPTMRFESTSVVTSADYDGDGDQDLFVGVRLQEELYGIPSNGYILNNDGKGNFTNVSKKIAPGLENIGMITDAIWVDLDKDNDQDLIVIGEYMPVKIFLNEDGKFMDYTKQAGLSESNGWWNRIKAFDLDNDGDLDFVIGNHGLNSRFRSSTENPVCLYINDFDQNGTVEQILCTFDGKKNYPMPLRHDLVSQIPSLKKKYLKYDNYKDQTISDVFTPEQLKDAIKLEAKLLSTSVLINEGGNKFTIHALPIEAQLAPIYGIEISDFDEDGNPDIILGGNFYSAKPEVGRYDASYGLFLKGDGKGKFVSIPALKSGIKMDGEVRDILRINITEGEIILVARNNDNLLALKRTKK
jgi:enediyne biosynthesis protein E4